MQGEVKVYYYNEVKEDILRYTSLFVVGDDAKKEIKPSRVRFQKNFVYIRFAGLRSLEEVSFLVGKEIYVREGDLPALEEGEYYEYQLIGLDVMNMNGEKMGVVESVLHTGANDVLVVAGDGELLVPLVEGHVKDIDVKQGFVRIDEGMLAP